MVNAKVLLFRRPEAMSGKFRCTSRPARAARLLPRAPPHMSVFAIRLFAVYREKKQLHTSEAKVK